MYGIVSKTKNDLIGIGEYLVIHLPPDMAFFKRMTIGSGNNVVVMGRKTMETLPGRYLPKRKNIVMTRNTELQDTDKLGFLTEHEMDYVVELSKVADVFIIGGAEIYKMYEPFINTWFITEVNSAVTVAEEKGPVFYRPDLSEFGEPETLESGVYPIEENYLVEYAINRYTRKPKESADSLD